MSRKMCNIHDYLEAIRAEPPPIDEKALADAKANMIVCGTFEEVVDTLQLLDEADDAKEKKKES
jgi:hypothetical protein